MFFLNVPVPLPTKHPNQPMPGLQPKIHTQKTQAIIHWSNQLIFAGISTLNCLRVQTGCVQTSFDKDFPEPLFRQGSLPPEEADRPFQSWKGQHKYFLVLAVNETGLPDTDLPFTQADATEITERLTVSDYQLSTQTIRYCQGRSLCGAQSFNPSKQVPRENLTTISLLSISPATAQSAL